MNEPASKTVDTALRSLAKDGELSIRVSGVCMQPLINDGARVIVHKQSLYWPGDVLVKRGFQGQLFAHRLIGFYPRKGGLFFVSCADNTVFADAPVAGSLIIGRVSGGECAGSVVRVPLRKRIKAFGQFVWWFVRRVGHRIMRMFQSLRA